MVRHRTIHSSRGLLNAHFEYDVDMSANGIRELKPAWTPFFRPRLGVPWLLFGGGHFEV